MIFDFATCGAAFETCHTLDKRYGTCSTSMVEYEMMLPRSSSAEGWVKKREFFLKPDTTSTVDQGLLQMTCPKN